MEFTQNEKNKNKCIVLEGYNFEFQKKLADDINRWTCVKKNM